LQIDECGLAAGLFGRGVNGHNLTGGYGRPRDRTPGGETVEEDRDQIVTEPVGGPRQGLPVDSDGEPDRFAQPPVEMVRVHIGPEFPRLDAGGDRMGPVWVGAAYGGGDVAVGGLGRE